MSSPFNNQHSEILLSISECAKMFGLSEKTIRRAIKQDEIHFIVIKNRYRVMFKDLLEWSKSRPRLEHSRDKKGIGQYVASWQIPDHKNAKEASNSILEKKQLTIFPSHKEGQLPL